MCNNFVNKVTTIFPNIPPEPPQLQQFEYTIRTAIFSTNSCALSMVLPSPRISLRSLPLSGLPRAPCTIALKRISHPSFNNCVSRFSLVPSKKRLLCFISRTSRLPSTPVFASIRNSTPVAPSPPSTSLSRFPRVRPWALLTPVLTALSIPALPALSRLRLSVVRPPPVARQTTIASPTIAALIASAKVMLSLPVVSVHGTLFKSWVVMMRLLSFLNKLNPLLL
ncbi:hypothetical protein BZA70DRAFT_194592 [Myxozyma melibiosi]|uniref:Uncharacterized protein n=1 Tax=Myxozyma melibiosi TaxID=54550 RepID=A0ABR1F3X7_9ASCO